MLYLQGYFTIFPTYVGVILNNVTEKDLANRYFFMNLGKPVGVYITKGNKDQITSRIKVSMTDDRKMYHAVPAPPKDRKKG